MSADGVDMEMGPLKVWRCSMCGALFRRIPDGLYRSRIEYVEALP